VRQATFDLGEPGKALNGPWRIVVAADIPKRPARASCCGVSLPHSVLREGRIRLSSAISAALPLLVYFAEPVLQMPPFFTVGRRIGQAIAKLYPERARNAPSVPDRNPAPP